MESSNRELTFRNYPKIKPVNNSINRPIWSVMIPTYNPGRYIRSTLKSVLDHDTDHNLMEICIVDDSSDLVDIRSILNEIDIYGRVTLYEHDTNVGLVGNWNRCLEYSHGTLIHILHQDDLIMSGFYDRMRTIFKSSPDIGAAFCRHKFIDELGYELFTSPIEAEESGPLSGFLEKIIIRQMIQTPSIVVKREVYEEIGGFDPDFFYTPDWDMWKRIAYYFPVWYEDSPLASFRIHSKSESTRLIHSGKDIQDIFNSIRLTQMEFSELDIQALCDRALVIHTYQYLARATKLLIKWDTKSALQNFRLVLNYAGWKKVVASLYLAFRLHILMHEKIALLWGD